MKSLKIATLIFGLLQLSEGKPCPEESKAHLTRCDSYFRCVVLPSKSHVWVPTKCERGLIYEPNLRICVLPGDDWECTLGESSLPKTDDNNIYGIDSLGFYLKRPEQDTKEVFLVEDVRSDSEDSDYIEVKNIGSNKNDSVTVASDKLERDDETYEFSGDGGEEENTGDQAELKGGAMDIPHPSKIDPNLSAHLQRLSQLIDGLKETYQKKENVNTELRPDQLNAFLAHYNIKSQFDAINPSSFDKQNIPQDGRIEPDILQHILTKQQKLNADSVANKTISLPSLNEDYVRIGTVTNPKPTPNYNTRVLIKNSIAQKHYRKPDRYSNSQIVVNRPEGSVLFTLPGGGYLQRPEPEDNSDPHISEETLKTVLELSKQMAANQNIRQVFPNNGFFQPYIQPMYFPVSLVSNHQGSHYPNHNNYNQQDLNDEKLQQISSSSDPYKVAHQRPTTSYQNSAIPVSISTGSDSGMIPRPISILSTQQPYYKDNQKVDSYGNKITEYDEYPPYLSTPSSNPVYQTTTFRPPLQYDSGIQYDPHVTPATYHTPSPHLNNFNANEMFDTHQKYPTLPYPSDPNSIQETPKPMQSSSQFFSRPNYSPINARPSGQALVQSDQQYNNFQTYPMPNQMHSVNPSSVRIRPNSVQTSTGDVNIGQSHNEHESEASESHFNYYQNNVNNQIVSDLLAPNVDHNSVADNNQLVNLGGNFISYDIYKNQLLPAIGGGNSIGNKVEIITCTAGVRQPNTTDCTKYYVCSKKDGKVLSYSCPPFTGFNPQTHICDAKTYSFCNPQAIYSRFTVSENRKIQMDAMQALHDAKRIRDEAIQAQNFANLIRIETQKVINNTIIAKNQGLQEPSTILMNYPSNKQSSAQNSIGYSTIQSTAKPVQVQSGNAGQKRRRYRCSDGAKIPDSNSVLNYYVCFKTSDGKLKRRKMTCTAGLIFCADKSVCTLTRKCDA